MSEMTIGSSMYDTVKKHDEEIAALKESERLNDERLKKLEDNAVKLENTVMSESRETRTTMKEQTEKLFTIVDKAMGYQSERTSQTHELKMAKISMWATVVFKVGGTLAALLSSGGILYYVFVHFITGGGN
ncbi:hypothetical protein FQ087_20960 [Sporosarcina sp. ANT_H38]|uniref:hypothetical protein n=1 Tax=Sporosarcina sp. ANT_H38 TaxID=2597358 RepID=UPI0011F2CE33|nr:hypothetical protein [Sporosarcina sp. ANT_H38]KAA0941627.1 hypothetical protein FQ087_20960 [Sporosarcina sp. ANT_H38]